MEKRYLLIPLILLSNFLPAQTISTIAGTGIAGFSGDSGQANVAQINVPLSLNFDTNGNLLFGDYNFRVRKIDASGIITTVAGNGSGGFSGDGGAATAAGFDQPYSIAIDDSNNFYISSYFPCKIRRVSSAGTISTVAGMCPGGSLGDGAPAYNSCLHFPWGLALDKKGNLYIADANNNRIRKIDAAGIIQTIAGNGSAGFNGDYGPALAAELNSPGMIAIDDTGNIYVSDYLNNRIRKIDTLGIIRTICGIGVSGYGGDGGPAITAKLNGPAGIAIDHFGNLYIADSGNNRIRRIDTYGSIATISGTGAANYNGDGIPAITAGLNYPSDLKFDKDGNLYIADTGNNRIRKIDQVAEARQVNGRQVQLMPNPANDFFRIEGALNAEVLITDIAGRDVSQLRCASQAEQIPVGQWPEGVYFVQVTTLSGTYAKKILVRH